MTVLAATATAFSRGGHEILTDVDISTQPGELLCIVGPNGSGKSTLLSALSGDLEPDRGTITLDGVPIRSIKARELAAMRGVLTQQHRVAFGFTAREVIEMGCLHADDSKAAMGAIVDQLDLNDLLDRAFRVLSGGEQARVALARVLMQNTPILLLDEPTAALDLRHQELVMTIARQQANSGYSAVVVVHDLNLASAHADRVALVARGGIIAQGSPVEVFQAERLTESYGVPVIVTDHPTRGCPLVLTDPRDSTSWP